MIGALIGAGASLIGGMLGRSSSEKAAREANAAQIAQQNEMFEKQAALQREFAQQGIQWKVDDARRSGIHPLYALGAQTATPSVSVGGFSPAIPNDPLPAALASAGQDVSRAIDATRTGSQRADAYSKTVQDLSLTKFGLENELLRTQIAKMRGQIGPAMPALSDTDAIPGQPATRSIMLPNSVRVLTPGVETKQDDISKEYGDEGLPQLVGQFRFARDYLKANPPIRIVPGGYADRAIQWFRRR